LPPLNRIDPGNDPLGEALWDYFKGADKATIKVISNLSDAEYIPAAYFFRRPEEMPGLERSALSHCKGKILDIGAGSGSHALTLAALGQEVYAMEISPGAVSLMLARGLKHVIHADIFSYSGEKFDTLLLMMNGIGIAGDPAGLDSLLAKLKTLLRPGGQVILDSSDIRYMYEEEDGSNWADQSPGYYGSVSYRMFYKEVEGPLFDWLFADRKLLEDSAIRAGLHFSILEEGPHFDFLARLELA
jgi:SAM-dependent methyltransferase